MLQIPDRGFIPSVTKHRGRLDVQADWIEASALFSADTISKSDVVDALLENNTYREQDFANEWVANVFRELDRRFHLLDAAGAIVMEGSRIRRVRSWRDRPAYAFCVALSAVPLFRQQVAKKCGTNYAEQGELFEWLCAESLRAMDWHIEQVGWSRAASSSMEKKVNALAAAIGEQARADGAIKRWTAPDAKDAGLDIVAWKSFPDGWGGRPICLLQCASGEDWIDKLCSPNIRTWEKLIEFSTEPRRGLAMPFAPEKLCFHDRANTDCLMLLMDRHRLLSPAREDPVGFPTQVLARKLVKWTKKRVAAFPQDNK